MGTQDVIGYVWAGGAVGRSGRMTSNIPKSRKCILTEQASGFGEERR